MKRLLSLLGAVTILPTTLSVMSFSTIDNNKDSNNLSSLITNTNLGDVDDSNDQDVLAKLLALNPNAPKDLYFVDNSLNSWRVYTNGNGEAIVKSLSVAGQVTVSYNNTITNNSSKANKGNLISDWSTANLSRKHVTTNQVNLKNKANYREYFDYGMWSGNKIDDFIKSGVNMKDATLAFITADSGFNKLVVGSDSQSITPSDANTAGTYTHMLKTNFIDPLYKANGNSFKGMHISFGGANSGGEVWDIAMKKYPGQADKIVENIKENIVNLCKDIAQVATGSTTVSDYPKSIDFDIESWHDVPEVQGVKYLFQALSQLKASDSSWEFSVTPAALPEEGMTSQTIYMLKAIAEAYSDQKLSVKDLPIINPMCMDYGTGYSGNKAVSEFELTRKTVIGVAKQYINALKPYYGDITLDGIISKMGATPMIGLNDTRSEVFTLEDAKELYNWAEMVGLAFISDWSGNADNPGAKVSPSADGLNYINSKDFSRTLNGDWNSSIINPNTSPKN